MDIKNLFRKKNKSPRCSAVIVAAGSSERMGTDKMLMELCGMPVIARTLTVFQQCPEIDDIVVVTRRDRIEMLADLCHKYGISKVSQVVAGGATRAESALAGVSAVKCRAELIALHDGARPLVTTELISKTVSAAAEHLAAAPGIKSTDTLKTVDEKGFITSTLDRSSIVRIQTPQIFNSDLIKGALTKAVSDKLAITDDCSAVEMMGVKTCIVDGENTNIKLTSPDDLVTAAAILSERGEADAYRTRV